MLKRLQYFFYTTSRTRSPSKQSKFRHVFEIHPRYFWRKLIKELPSELKHLRDVMRCSNCHQSISRNIRNTKCYHIMFWKCIDRTINAKNWAERFFQKAFLNPVNWVHFLICSKKDFLRKIIWLIFWHLCNIYGFLAHDVVMFYARYIAKNRLMLIRTSHDVQIIF